MPKYLTLGILALTLWVLVWSGELWTGTLPAAIILGTAIADYRMWTRRGRPWHDRATILLLLPAIAAAVWIAVGGLILGDRPDDGRLLGEVGPGVGLTGLLCTLVSYHGRHHPGG